MLNHRPTRGHLQTFEAFASYFFPSSPTESFSSIILGKLPVLSTKKSHDEFPIEFCEVIISLWARCLQEKYVSQYLSVKVLPPSDTPLERTNIPSHGLNHPRPQPQNLSNSASHPRLSTPSNPIHRRPRSHPTLQKRQDPTRRRTNHIINILPLPPLPNLPRLRLPNHPPNPLLAPNPPRLHPNDAKHRPTPPRLRTNPPTPPNEYPPLQPLRRPHIPRPLNPRPRHRLHNRARHNPSSRHPFNCSQTTNQTREIRTDETSLGNPPNGRFHLENQNRRKSTS